MVDSGIRGQWSRFLMSTYQTPAVEAEYGRSATLFDPRGRDFVDFLGGIAVASLGYGHPGVAAAVAEQAVRLTHASNLVATRPVVEVGAALVGKFRQACGGCGDARVFFCNSGTEANEAALKLARLTRRTRVLAAQHGFHGRTMGALSITGQPAKRDMFAPLPDGAEFFPYGDAGYLRALIEMDPQNTAAVIVEPIQGETGVVPAPGGFLAEVRRLCDEFGLLMILDEVQTGVGRTGDFFAFEHDGVVPDVVTLAKGLGAGLPIGAVLAHGRAAGLFHPGDHGTTFGGNPVSCAAAGVVLETIDAAFLAEVRARGEKLAAGLATLPGVVEVRGRGLMRAAVLDRGVAKHAVSAGVEHGVILNACGVDVLRFVPPLVITHSEVELGLERTRVALEAAYRGENERRCKRAR
ncbi:acetylornithine aminotransferase [Corynebacterium atypicum]|uniref:Acetylornithine aminotransferase n=1 Tax=Corynebacterium atypicum TaxID=191610 RepID=A0ABM5QN25_9CORY|nr:acetylornithine transaminase [Corynebacterium atypicum]AIG64198.1 acetylornithine aminotransferase [Corynebacterium atypicum]